MMPYYQDDAVTIYHGDCREMLPIECDAVITDPPYGVGCDWWDERVPHELLSLFMASTTGPVVWFGAAPQHRNALLAFDPQPERVMVWAPRFTLSKTMAKGIAYRWHPIYVWQIPDKHDGPVWDVLTSGTGGHNWWNHPATKPLELMKSVVGLCPAGTILDPFMGSGTTLRAAKDLGRKAIGIEIEEKYCEIAARRMEQEVLPL